MTQVNVQEVIQTIDLKIYALEVAVQTVNSSYPITKDVAETLTASFIADLKEIKSLLIAE